MAIPNSIDRATPLGTDTPGAGDDQIRALKLFIEDVFGIPDATSITNEPMNIGSDGSIVINDTSADIDFRVEGANNANMIVLDAGQDALSFGGANVDGAAFIFNNLQSRTFITSVGSQVHIPAQTTNFDNGSGTIAVGAGFFLGIPTWTGDTATLTITDAATLYIAGAPVDSTNVTGTNLWSLLVGGGASKFVGTLVVATASSGASAVGAAGEFVIEDSAGAGMSILTGTGSVGTIAFGDSGDADIGRITYDHSSNDMTFIANATVVMTLDSAANVGVGVTAFGTSATNVIGITADGTVPSSSPAGMIQIFADDSSDGSTNATLAIRTEQAVEATATFTQSHRLQIWVNGVEYYLSLDDV